MALSTPRLVALTGLLLTAPTSLFPCTCVDNGRLDDDVDSATAVFIGKVTEIQGASTHFEVERTLKGRKTNTLTVHRGKDQDCDFDFSQGVEYFVFASGPMERLTVSKCSPTSEWGKERFSARGPNSEFRITPYQIGIFCFIGLVAILLYSDIIPRKSKKSGNGN